MRDDVQGRQRIRKRLWLALAAFAAVLVVLLVPPLVSIGRYKSQITRLMSASLGRPVRLSSVSLHLLPRPGLELTDLTVEEDPAYGAEPVLHANSVTASFRLLALWRGKLQISRISVDEASLNLVRSSAGRWNLDSLFHTVAAQPGAGGPRRSQPLPYLEATNSRINLMNGVEKLPFSLLNTDVSFWQEEPGEWRLRLRGDPTRTDLSQEGADTGEVQLEASLRQAPELRRIPLHLDLEWKDAQLGQLTRLVIGSDPGWRGDLTGELHMDGTADAAQIKTRLRATGVHRAEFAPAAPLDFDARCGLVYHYTARSVENLTCDSPLGDGTVHIAGDLPGNASPRISVALSRIPVEAALDALRTVRSNLGPGLQAIGTISGTVAYDENPPAAAAPAGKSAPAKAANSGAARAAAGQPAPAADPVTGSLTVQGFQLSGDGLSQPILIPKLVLQPVAGSQAKQTGPSQPPALTATTAFPAGGPVPLTVATRLTLLGYQVTVHGDASVARARELAHVAGMADAALLDSLAGEPLAVDLSAEGPWMPAEKNPFAAAPVPVPAPAPASAPLQAAAPPPAEADENPTADSLSGAVTLRNANWKTDYLAGHLMISQATLHIDRSGGSGTLRWDPVVFSYGPVKGTASLTIPVECDAPQPCLPSFQIQLGDLDADALQAAFLGAHEKGTMISTLLARLRPSSAPLLPQAEGVVQADSLVLGPVTLQNATVALRLHPTDATVTSLDAALLGGSLHATGVLQTPQSDQDKPAYTLEGQFLKLNPAAVGQLLGQRWSGEGSFDANGKIDLSGYTGKDLAASAKGTLHFEWRHGAVTGAAIPPALARFDRWTADAALANGALTLGPNQLQQSGRTRAVSGSVTLSDPPKAAFTVPKDAPARKR